MLLITKQLSIGYTPDKKVAEKLSLSVQPGELICLIGPNGSGKSTLLKTVAGLMPAISGSVYVNEQPLETIPASEKAKHIAVVFTNKIQVENLSVYNAVGMGRTPYTGLMGTLKEEDRKIIEQTIAVTGLKGFENKFFDKLSDGEQQKVLIGRAITQDCPIILLDEPTAHLDTVNKIQITLLLKKIAKEQNKSIVISTHDLGLALQIADKIWLMFNNSVSENRPSEIINTKEFDEAFSGNNFSFDKNSFSFKII